LYALVKKIDPENEVISIQIKEFDPSTLFRDDHYNKTKARLTQIEKSEELDVQEQYKTYKDIISEGKNKNAELKKELARLKAIERSRAAPTSTYDAEVTTPGGAAR